MNARLFDRLAATLSIVLLLVLAGGSYYLAELSNRQPTPRMPDKTLHEPDAFVERFSMTRIDHAGSPVFRLEAARARHFPDDGSIELEQVRGISLRVDRSALTITANAGRADDRARAVDLTGDVKVRRAGVEGQPDLLVQTEAAKILVDEEIARTDLPVRITQGDSFLTGVGMELNNAERSLQLRAQVRGRYDPQKAVEP